MSTSTTGLPVAWSARSSLSWDEGRREVGAVAAREAGVGDLHLLAFHIAGQASHEHDHVRRPRGLQRLVERLLGAGQLPAQADLRVADRSKYSRLTS